jgi:hypothetical protein
MEVRSRWDRMNGSVTGTWKTKWALKVNQEEGPLIVSSLAAEAARHGSSRNRESRFKALVDLVHGAASKRPQDT